SGPHPPLATARLSPSRPAGVSWGEDRGSARSHPRPRVDAGEPSRRRLATRPSVPTSSSWTLCGSLQRPHQRLEGTQNGVRQGKKSALCRTGNDPSAMKRAQPMLERDDVADRVMQLSVGTPCILATREPLGRDLLCSRTHERGLEPRLERPEVAGGV